MACEYNFADKAAFDNFIKELEKLRKFLSAKGETVVPLPDEIVFYNDELGVAGKPDLITVDKQGKYRIYDLKTKKGQKTDATGKIIPGAYSGTKLDSLDKSYDNKMTNRTKYSRQMTVYDILAHNSHGIKFEEAFIIPLEASRKNDTVDYSVTEAKFVLTENAMKAKLYKDGISPSEEGKIDYKANKIAEYSENPPSNPIALPVKPKQRVISRRATVTNDRGMHTKPDTKSSLILVDESGRSLGAFTLAQFPEVGPQTLDGVPIEEQRQALESPEINVGSKVTLRAIITDQFEEIFEEDSEDSAMRLPIYIFDENNKIIGRVQSFSAEVPSLNNKAIEEFRRNFYEEFKKSNEHFVSGTISAKKVQTSSNINNARTQNGDHFFYTLEETFGERYYYDNDGNLQFGQAPIILLAMKGASIEAMQWNYKAGEIETLSDNQLNKLDKDLADTDPATKDNMRAGQLGVAIVDPVTGKYKVVPVATRELTESAVEKVVEAFLDNNLEVIHEIVGVNQLEDKNTDTNPKFLKFATFEKRGDKTIYDQEGRPITTLNDLLDAEFEGNFEDIQELYRELKENEKDFVVYFYSDTKAAITEGNGIIKITADNLRAAINGEEFEFGSVALQTNKATGNTKFRVDETLDEAQYEEVRNSIVEDFKNLLRRKRFQVDTSLANRTQSYFPKGFTSPMTGNKYNNYQEYLNSQDEGLGTPPNASGAQSVIVTDIYNDSGALHHDIGIELEVGEEATQEEYADDVVEVIAPEQVDDDTNDEEVGLENPWDDVPFSLGTETAEETIKREEAIQYLEDRFPGFGVVIFEKARQVGEGVAHGWFENMAFHVWSNAEVGTEYHEAFHGMFRMFLTNTQRSTLYNEAKKIFSDTDIKSKEDQLKRIYKKFNEAEISELALEELMADKFRDYVISEQEDKSLGKAISDFFKDLYLFIKALVTSNLTMKQVFRIANAKSGTMLGRTKARMLRNSDKFITPNSDVNIPFAHRQGLSDGQVRSLSNQIARHVIDTIDATEGGVTEYNKLNPMGDFGAIPMWYLSRSMSIEENGKLVPLTREIAVEYKKAYKAKLEGDLTAWREVIGKYGIKPTPPDEVKGTAVRKRSIHAAFHNVGINWEDNLDNSPFQNIETRGWRYFVEQELAKRNIKTKFKGTDEITLDEDEDTIIDKIYNLASEEVDHRQKLSAKIKEILSKVESPIPNFLGYKTYLDPNEVYRMIISNAINSRNYKEFIANLEYAGRGLPAITKIAEEISKLSIQEKAMVRHGFTLAANEFFAIRKRLNINQFGDVKSVSYAFFNPDRRSQIIDGVIRTKNRIYQEASNNPRALYDVRVNPASTAKEYIPIRKNVQKVLEAYEKFEEVYRDRKSDLSKLSKATADVLDSLGIWYGSTLDQHKANVKKVLTQGLQTRNKDVVQGREAVAELFYPRGTDVNIENIIAGLSMAGKSVYDTESSTLAHLLTPLQMLELPFTNSFIDANGKNKYPVNTPKGYNDVEYAVKSGELIESLRQDEIFTPHPRLQTMFAYLMDRAKFRNQFKIIQFGTYADSSNFEASDFKARGKKTALLVALNAFLNQGSTDFAYIMLPTAGDRQGAWYMRVPRMNSAELKQFTKRDILERMILAELTKINTAREKVRNAIYNLEDKTDDEIAEALSELVVPFHVPDKLKVDFSKPRQAAQMIAKAREEGKFGTGETFSIFNVLSDTEFFKSNLMSEYVEQYINSQVGDGTVMTAEEIAAFESKLNEMLDTLETSIAEETAKMSDTLVELGLDENSIDRDAFDKADNYTTFDEFVEDLVFTDMVYRAEFAKAFRGGIDFAGDPTKFYKRMSTMGTPGPTLTLQSELEDEEKGGIEDYGMLDEFNEASFYDFGWVSGKRDVSNYLKDLNAVADRIGGEVGEVVRKAYQPDNIEGIDGTALISLKMYRHYRMGEGKWLPEDEAAYQEYKETGKFNRPVYILKPLYDGTVLKNGKITPLIDKTAYVPLIKELTENRPMIDEIRKRMENEGEYASSPELHVMYAISAKKLSRQGSVSLSPANIEGSKRALLNTPVNTLPGRILRTAQPTVEVEKTKIKIQRQFRKNIIANINKNGEYSLSGQTASGQQLFDLFHAAISEKIKKSTRSFMKEFGFDDLKAAVEAQDRQATLKAKQRFLQKFQDILRDEIEERELNINYSDAIKLVADQLQGIAYNIPLSFPTLERKFENIFFALFKSRVLNQEIKGIEVPQIAELGGFVTDKGEQNKLKFTRLQGEKVIAAEAAISQKLLDKMGLKVGDEIVGFRVPNQGMSSMIVFRINKVLPDSYEKAIMVPTPITKLMGSDFDIDKMFLMFPEVDKKTGKILDVPYSEILDNPSNVSSLTNAQLSNLMLDVSKAILLDPNHLIETQRPLDSPLFGDIKEKMLQIAPQVRLQTDPETGKEVINFNSLLTELEMESRNKLGIAKRGSYANVIAGRNVAVHGDIQINTDFAPMINGVIYNRVTQKTMMDSETHDFIVNTIGIDILQEEYTDYYISLYLSAAVDAAKDPLQHYLNDTPGTTRVISLMLSVGIDPVTIAMFLNQPGIRAVTDRYMLEETTPNMMKAIASEVVTEKYELELPEDLIVTDMNIEELYDNINEANFIDEEGDIMQEHAEKQLDLINNFLAFFSAGGELQRSYSVMAADNAKNIGQSAGIQAFMDAHDAFVYELNQENFVYGVQNVLEDDSYPFSKAYVDAYKSVLDVSGYLFNSYSPASFYFKDKIRLMTGRASLTEEQHNLISRAINYHLLTSEGSPLAPLMEQKEINKRYFGVVGVDENGQEIIDESKTVIAVLEKVQEFYPKLAETSFMKAMSNEVEFLTTVEEKSTYFRYLIMSNKPRTQEESNDMISTFEDLLFNPQVFIDSEGKTQEEIEFQKEQLIMLGEMFIQNAMITKAFSLGENSYSELIPARWISESGLSDFFRKKELELDEYNALDSFLFDFMRQFGTSIAPELNSKKGDGLPLTIEGVTKSDGTYDRARGIFSTFAKVYSIYGTQLYMLDKVTPKGKAIYTKVMQKGRPGKFVEHNLRNNGKIDNQKSLIRLGDMDITGKYGMSMLTYFAVNNMVYNKGKNSGQAFMEAHLGLPLSTEGGKRTASKATKKCN